ncbi:MAG: YIP1 family protein [Methanobacteriota archaeon]|nr:MAG: YIP1 family protein [Euryarchaeota archaeon]
MAKKIRVCKECGRQIPSNAIKCSICSVETPSVISLSNSTTEPVEELPRRGGLEKSALLSIPYSPKKAFESLYLSGTLRVAVVVLATTSILVGAWSLLKNHMFDQSANLEWPEAIQQGSLIFTTLGLIAILGAYFSRRLYRGRGDYRSSFILVSFIAPWEFLFVVCFGFLSWEPAINLIGSLIVTGAFVVWMFWVCGMAISVANDISIGQGVTTVLIASYLCGIIIMFTGIALSEDSLESDSIVMMSLIAIIFVLLTLKLKPSPRTSNRRMLRRS